MATIQLVIDGREVTTDADSTILEAAERAGIEIPRLCHQEGLTPSGNCRICVVEVEGSRTLVGSCHTPATDGMVVRTRTPRVLEARRATIELLITGHTGPCVTDAECRECGLHRLAADLEAGPPRFRVKKPRFYSIEDVSPYIRRDLSRCILCRKCIRACAEVAGPNLYAMAYRGFASKVVADCDKPLDDEACRDCGICIDACPTSALLEAEGGKRREERTRRDRPEPHPDGRSDPRLLELLEERQRIEGFISEEAMGRIARELGLSLSDVYGVATFYSFLSSAPLGRNVIRVCKSLPCHLKEGAAVLESITRGLGIGPGETTADGMFSLELTNCIGACDVAPAMLVNDHVYGDLTPAKIAEILESYREG